MDSSSGCATSNSTFVLVLAFSACVEEETSHKRNKFDIRQRPRPSSKDRTEAETSLEVWNAGREYECSVDLYFGNREGDEAKRSGNTTSIAQEAILQLQAPSIPTLLQTLLQRKACAAKEESSCLQQQQTMVFRTSSSPNPKAILEKESSRLDSSLQRQTIIVRRSSSSNLHAILAFLALVGQRQWT
jgi:hypothetical protein